MKLLTAAQMREVDRITIEECGIPGPVLMRQAAQAVVRLAQQHFAGEMRGRIGILCGRGNNGGDGMVVARLLRDMGARVLLVLLGDPAGIHGDAALAWQAVEAMARSREPDFELRIVPDETAWPAACDELTRCTLLIDALLGTGIASPVRGLARQAIADLNQRRGAMPVVAVDLPSGLPSDADEATAEEGEAILQADWTVTFTAPKLGQFLSSHADRAGRLRVEAIGTPDAVMNRPDFAVEITTGATCRPFLQPRATEAHKGSFGHVLVLGGSVGKSGAAALAGAAALRMGAGLVTVAAPVSVQPLVAGYRPELMTEPLPETPQGTLALTGLKSGRIGELVAARTVLAIGPGVSQSPETAELVRRLVLDADRPLVLDADGLNAFAGQRERLRARTAGTVLTPHPGEMSRLFDVSTAEVQTHRRAFAQRLAEETGAIVVLKGHLTLVAAPDGRLFVNTSGNPGMATGGTGDVLTGMVAGLLAQFSRHDRLHVVAAAVYLHGLAGDEAALVRGEMSLLAGDLIDCIPRAIARATSDRSELPREWRAFHR